MCLHRQDTVGDVKPTNRQLMAFLMGHNCPIDDAFELFGCLDIASTCNVRRSRSWKALQTSMGSDLIKKSDQQLKDNQKCTKKLSLAANPGEHRHSPAETPVAADACYNDRSIGRSFNARGTLSHTSVHEKPSKKQLPLSTKVACKLKNGNTVTGCDYVLEPGMSIGQSEAASTAMAIGDANGEGIVRVSEMHRDDDTKVGDELKARLGDQAPADLRCTIHRVRKLSNKMCDNKPCFSMEFAAQRLETAELKDKPLATKKTKCWQALIKSLRNELVRQSSRAAERFPMEKACERLHKMAKTTPRCTSGDHLKCSGVLLGPAPGDPPKCQLSDHEPRWLPNQRNVITTQTDRKLIAKALLCVLHRDAIRQCLSKFGKLSESNMCEQRHKMVLRVNPKDRSNHSATAKARANTGLLRASVGKANEIEETLSASGSFLSPCGGGETHVQSKKKHVEAENNRKRSADVKKKTSKRKKLNRRLTLTPRDPNSQGLVVCRVRIIP